VFPRDGQSRQDLLGAGPLQARGRVDAEPRAESGIDADPDGRGTVRVLRAQLATAEAAIVDAHLGLPAAETRADAMPRPAPCERAVLLADRSPAALAVAGAGRPDTVARGAGAVVEAGVPRRAVRAAAALDTSAAAPRRCRALRRVCEERGHGGVISALGDVAGDARDAAREVGQGGNWTAARGAARYADRGAGPRIAEERGHEVVA